MVDSVTRVQEFRLKLYVNDFSSRRRFYQNTLRWNVTNQWGKSAGRGVMFDTGSGIVELIETDADYPAVKGCDVSLRVEDVWRLWEDLRDKADVVFALRDNPWGDTSFCIADPGGFEITFFTEIK